MRRALGALVALKIVQCPNSIHMSAAVNLFLLSFEWRHHLLTTCVSLPQFLKLAPEPCPKEVWRLQFLAGGQRRESVGILVQAQNVTDFLMVPGFFISHEHQHVIVFKAQGDFVCHLDEVQSNVFSAQVPEVGVEFSSKASGFGATGEREPERCLFPDC